MNHRIIEISTNNKKLTCYRGFLRVEEKGNVLSDIPFHSIQSLMITGHNVVYTNNLLQKLCEENIPLIILGKNYAPTGMLISYIGQNKQMEIQHLQLENKKPLEKQIWQTIIKEKIKNQSKVLDFYQKDNPIKEISKTVLSGDSSGREAYAARLYFKALFGNDFIRGDEFNIINAFLNYGYAVLRSALARYVVASGLNPSFGISHHNKLNPFCLVDDIIEPFRPIIDCAVYSFFQNNSEITELATEHKRFLSGLLTTEYDNGEGVSELHIFLQKSVWDLANIYKTKEVVFSFNPHFFKG